MDNRGGNYFSDYTVCLLTCLLQLYCDTAIVIIAIEGMDKAGKQTQSVMLKRELAERDISSKLFHFPIYTTDVGKAIRRHLGSRGKAADRTKWRPEILHCMQAANKWEHYYDIKDAVKQYDVVIMDRYTASNIAYGLANGMPKSWISNLEKRLPKADCTILLDIPAGESFSRHPNRRDAFEKDRNFLEIIKYEYCELAKEKNWITINADNPKDIVHKNIMKKLAPFIQNIPKQKRKKPARDSKRDTKKAVASKDT